METLNVLVKWIQQLGSKTRVQVAKELHNHSLISSQDIPIMEENQEPINTSMWEIEKWMGQLKKEKVEIAKWNFRIESNRDEIISLAKHEQVVYSL